MKWLDKQPVWLIIALAIVIAMPISIAIAVIKTHDQNFKALANCQVWQNLNAGALPARCIYYYEHKQ